MRVGAAGVSSATEDGTGVIIDGKEMANGSEEDIAMGSLLSELGIETVVAVVGGRIALVEALDVEAARAVELGARVVMVTSVFSVAMTV
jgi:hypothetical protein